jgi:EpsI family protein
MLNRAVLVFAILVLAAGAVARADRYDYRPERKAFDAFPMQIGDWRGIRQAPLEADVLNILKVDDYLTRVFMTPDRRGVGLYIGYWASQRQGSTIHSPLNCLPGAGWEPVLSDRISLPASQAGGPSMLVNRYIVQKGLDRELVLYWYQSHGRVIASEYWSKFYLVADAIRLSRSDGAIVRVTAPIVGEGGQAAEAAAMSTASTFIHDLVPVLDPYLPR